MQHGTQIPLTEILQQARTLGVKISVRTFWKYYEAGLLPKGKKIAGRGNVAYFPSKTVFYLYFAAFLKSWRPLPLSVAARAGSGKTAQAAEAKKALWLPVESVVSELKKRDWRSLPPISECRRRASREFSRLLPGIFDVVVADPPWTIPSRKLQRIMSEKGSGYESDKRIPVVGRSIGKKKKSQARRRLLR